MKRSAKSSKPLIQGPGLKKEGVVVLQSFFIFIFTSLELFIRQGAGIVSGLIVVVVLYGGLRFGRKGTAYVSVVTPPLAFAATVLLYLFLTVGFKPSRLGIDFLASLSSIAPYLLVSALYGWFVFLNEKAKARKPKPRA
jgi:hypothetical protein